MRVPSIEDLQTIKQEAQGRQVLDAALSFEPIERTMAKMVFEAREQLAAKDAALTDPLRCLAKVVEAHGRA